MATGGGGLLSVDFEVIGKVQGVFFRKYTQKNASQRGLVGWVQNTERGSVTGKMQGPEKEVKDMKRWLKKTGSPKSRIDRCIFKDEQTITQKEFRSFDIVK
ncbi:acylphosphatase-2-like [Mizuhopecten yessoensis]|uniref:Acylphosphatase n=1 Tax=Mizuhopecten yessoensis TaxID=6573 RepID=A0A210PXJ7_MIZYE|nr:acylphosphatase-2-like [Mizuhopecten yessoensis]OWF41196.1 Acylphosphatase-1 [Mizuhopecten yessoensis]